MSNVIMIIELNRMLMKSIAYIHLISSPNVRAGILHNRTSDGHPNACT